MEIKGGFYLKIQIGLDGVKMTNVPFEEELNEEKIYYVYEWFIKETNQIIYIGKGKGDRYKDARRNTYFNMIVDRFECDVRFIKEGLTEYEALMLEEELFAQREGEGHVLSNIVTPNSPGVFEVPVPYEYMKVPVIHSSRIAKYYFGMEDVRFDAVVPNRLIKTHIAPTTYYGAGKLYIDTDEKFIDQDRCEKAVKPLLDEVKSGISKMGGKVYKTRTKSIQSLIFYNTISYEDYFRHKENGCEVYHLIDVVNYFRGK